MNHILRVDFPKCSMCDMCENVLPGFRTVHGGIACDFRQWGVTDSEISALLCGVRDKCPSGALILVTY